MSLQIKGSVTCYPGESVTSTALHHAMPTSCDPKTRQRAHVERMLARAERRSRQALQLVEKWKTKLTDLDQEDIAAKQAKLFADDRPGAGK